MNTENISEREGLERLENLVRGKSYKEASAFALDLRDRFPASFQIGFLYYGILVKLESYSESESVLDELLKLYPENINLLLEKGELLIGRGKTAESKLFFDKVLFLDPFNDKAKEGVDRTKVVESGASKEPEKNQRKNSILEDTMKESDLERFMSESDDESEDIDKMSVEDPEEELDISLSESGMGFSTGLDNLLEPDVPVGETESPVEEKEQEILPSRQDTVKTVDVETSPVPDDTGIPEKVDSTEIPVEEEKAFGKVESALEELNKFSSSDINDLGLDENVTEKEEVPVEDPGVSDEDAFATESAALLYLKQGLYEDAKNVYSKLYKGSNEDLFVEKVDKIERVEKANMKIIALEGFLEKIRTGSVRIV
ncbi:MAG: hypothetical protein ABFR36_08455 [Acidobacteriota bacterium]